MGVEGSGDIGTVNVNTCVTKKDDSDMKFLQPVGCIAKMIKRLAKRYLSMGPKNLVSYHRCVQR
jgi:hypothetical protein